MADVRILQQKLVVLIKVFCGFARPLRALTPEGELGSFILFSVFNEG